MSCYKCTMLHAQSEPHSKNETLDLIETYVQLRPDHSAHTWAASEFWSAVSAGKVGATGFGLLVSTYTFDKDWPTWEMHPDGDELVCLLEGRMDLIVEVAGAERRISLAPGRTAIVPKGVWHRAIVHQPSTALHVTPGDGTQNRPVA